MEKTREWYGKEKTWNLRLYPHPGKYEGGFMVDEHVHTISLDGCDEEIGDVSEYGAWCGLLTLPLLPPEWVESARDETDLTGEEIDFLASVGAIIAEDDRGFVYVSYFDDAQELAAAWGAEVGAYEEWCEEVNEDE